MFPASNFFRLAVLLLIAGFAVFPVAGRVVADTAPTQISADTTTVDTGKLEGMVCGGASYELAFFGTAGSTVTLPDIFITENRSGALGTDGFVALAIGTGRIAAFDISHASLKAYRTSDNADITAYLIDGNSLASHVRGITANMTFKLANISDAMTGAARIVLSGVKADIPTTASSGEVNLTVGGAATGNPDLYLPVGDIQGICSDLGSRASKSILKVGYIGSNVFVYPYPCTSSWLLTSWNAECEIFLWRSSGSGKPGSIFIAAVVPNSSGIGGIYFKDDSGAWIPFTSCAAAPAYSTGTLGNCKFRVLNQADDVSAIKGTYIYAGFGLVKQDSPPGTACNNMVEQGTYSLMQTIP